MDKAQCISFSIRSLLRMLHLKCNGNTLCSIIHRLARSTERFDGVSVQMDKKKLPCSKNYIHVAFCYWAVSHCTSNCDCLRLNQLAEKADTMRALTPDEEMRVRISDRMCSDGARIVRQEEHWHDRASNWSRTKNPERE